MTVDSWGVCSCCRLSFDLFESSVGRPSDVSLVLLSGRLNEQNTTEVRAEG